MLSIMFQNTMNVGLKCPACSDKKIVTDQTQENNFVVNVV